MKKILLLLSIPLMVMSCTRGYKVKGDQVFVTCENAVVRLQVVSPEIIRVSATPDGKFSTRQSLVVVPQEAFRGFKVEKVENDVRVSTDSLTAVVAQDGTVEFRNSKGDIITGGGRFSFAPINVEDKDAWSVRTRFDSTPDESFYGLGQQQAGEFDHKGKSEELYQYNTKVSVPFVVSTKGYGLLFDA